MNHVLLENKKTKKFNKNLVENMVSTASMRMKNEMRQIKVKKILTLSTVILIGKVSQIVAAF